MLQTRVITAVILAIVFLSALFALPPFGWIFFTFIITMVGCWEWSRIAGLHGPQRKIFLGISWAGGIGLLYWFSSNSADSMKQLNYNLHLLVTILASLFWILVVPIWLKFAWRPKNVWILAMTGWLLLFSTWLAVVDHRSDSPWVLLGLMGLVWVADIAAYFSGRTFGKHKLAPRISPGKTWEGVAGAVLGSLIYAAICIRSVEHYDNRLIGAIAESWPIVIIVTLILVALSIIGDLFESWMKRGAGLKDSSNLLPGHGGVLDRLDALTSTLPVAPGVFIIALKLLNL